MAFWNHPSSRPYLLISIFLWIGGWLYYTWFRCGIPLWSYHACLSLEQGIGLYLPSWIHVMAISLLSVAVWGKARFAAIAGFWTLINICFEFIQGIFPSMGTFDWADVFAILFAWVCLRLWAWYLSYRTIAQITVSRAVRITVALFGILSITATSQVPLRPVGDAVLISEKQLRQSVKALEPRPMIRPGKIYRKDHWLFVNDKQLGIHVYDNRDPSNPKNIAFIHIPGNVDMAISGNVLYADSLMDLVAIDISRLPFVKELQRLKDTFPSRDLSSLVYIPYEDCDCDDEAD